MKTKGSSNVEANVTFAKNINLCPFKSWYDFLFCISKRGTIFSFIYIYKLKSKKYIIMSLIMCRFFNIHDVLEYLK